MRITTTGQREIDEYLREVEAVLDQIRYDRSLDDGERAQQIGEVLASANARALRLHAAERAAAGSAVPSDTEVLAGPRGHRGLARTG